jgi:hypothetical protein
MTSTWAVKPMRETVMTVDESGPGNPNRMRSFEAPPEGFDPLTAAADLLSRHGIPRRPHPEREPYLAGRWAEVLGRPLLLVPAELAADPPSPRRGDAEPPNYGVEGWAGVGRAMLETRFLDPDAPPIGIGAVPDTYTRPATFVSAEWVVPDVTGDPGNLDNHISIWVGLDGFPEGDLDWGERVNALQILRGGVTASGYPDGGAFRWHAWAEWYTYEPEGEVEESVRGTVTNLPVQSGDTVGVVVCVGEPRSATVSLANLSRDQGTSVAIDTPSPHGHSGGATAEWIVEGGPPATSLPFTPVSFDSCVAGSSSEVFHLTPDAIATNMFEVPGIGERGPDVTRTRITSPTTAVVEWVGAGGS